MVHCSHTAVVHCTHAHDVHCRPIQWYRLSYTTGHCYLTLQAHWCHLLWVHWNYFPIDVSTWQIQGLYSQWRLEINRLANNQDCKKDKWKVPSTNCGHNSWYLLQIVGEIVHFQKQYTGQIQYHWNYFPIDVSTWQIQGLYSQWRLEINRLANNQDCKKDKWKVPSTNCGHNSWYLLQIVGEIVHFQKQYTGQIQYHTGP